MFENNLEPRIQEKRKAKEGASKLKTLYNNWYVQIFSSSYFYNIFPGMDPGTIGRGKSRKFRGESALRSFMATRTILSSAEVPNVIGWRRSDCLRGSLLPT